MTSLITWVSRDHQRFAALHVASDSRVSWEVTAGRWDAGRKVFASKVTPDIWAYCGDVLFPALVLSQLVSAADHGLVLGEGPPEIRHARAVEAMQASFRRRHRAVERDFTILHASREGEGRDARPRLWRTSVVVKTGTWVDEELAIDENFAGVVERFGTGRVSMTLAGQPWKGSAVGETSRAVYSGFCDSLKSGKDPSTGGAPQLASLFPRGPGRTSGVLHDGDLYLHGLPILEVCGASEIEWYDRLFQRIDPTTRARRLGAARQPRPKGI
ncbi:MAG: hypothetical protein EPN98_07815 [Phenylobacterium sp.]|uniref:hypothetical protein n=1 Tax=Phenylobacterium sp. TaxID=1871053 RepID=UPI00121FB7A7|nr:hypothetical protein [Phenylobacterium sp.]TAL34955.1 MAG: hypothetical protein EPN98_07815 [Phenylobacterium sp.]